MICTHCKAEVTRFITKGPYCSVACKDRYEDAAEIAALKAKVESLISHNASLTIQLGQADRKAAALEADNESLRTAARDVIEDAALLPVDDPISQPVRNSVECFRIRLATPHPGAGLVEELAELRAIACLVRDDKMQITALTERLAAAQEKARRWEARAFRDEGVAVQQTAQVQLLQGKLSAAESRATDLAASLEAQTRKCVALRAVAEWARRQNVHRHVHDCPCKGCAAIQAAKDEGALE